MQQIETLPRKYRLQLSLSNRKKHQLTDVELGEVVFIVFSKQVGCESKRT